MRSARVSEHSAFGFAESVGDSVDMNSKTRIRAARLLPRYFQSIHPQPFALCPGVPVFCAFKNSSSKRRVGMRQKLAANGWDVTVRRPKNTGSNNVAHRTARFDPESHLTLINARPPAQTAGCFGGFGGWVIENSVVSGSPPPSSYLAPGLPKTSGHPFALVQEFQSRYQKPCHMCTRARTVPQSLIKQTIRNSNPSEQ